ncbi:hypothetical protein C9374_008055 [Naegleria lovaniensis]|uniref:Mediator of RNA polymerase II transcription subunit 22 n=1 Tax=Naegleria lovaniensis TaxID=51637 RepID=A0AA88GAY1_NAELO|nr:uncharacterized protein C9374_012753 [Naegleria lovaniensis]XP_044546169.1 uncharacterized protein C9374_008055 [Naegleria lovaniensis]KAG2373151.1 hypothetical protein C9374_012753 [Naegleria lovaniensis]KAG2378907.1 hypothetical protein C9374_008055 [Naegleria lovaniensis]
MNQPRPAAANQPKPGQGISPLANLGKEQLAITDMRYEILDREINRLGLLMEQLVDASRVMDPNPISTKYVNKTQNEKDELQLSVTAASMADACQNLLRLTSDLQNSYLFFDFDRIEKTQANYLIYLEKQNNSEQSQPSQQM